MIYSGSAMTEYGHTNQKPPPLLSSDHVRERKAARRKIIDEAMERRRQIYTRFMEKKRRLHAGGEVI